MIRRPLTLLTLALIWLLASPAWSAAQGTDPRFVVAAFDAALNAGDVDATLALFADNAMVKTQTASYTGTTQLRPFFQQLVAQHFQFESSNHQVAGDRETHSARVSTDAWRRLGIAPLDATAEVVVQGGKITSFTVTYTSASLVKLQAAQVKAMPRTGGGGLAVSAASRTRMVGAAMGMGLGLVGVGLVLRRHRRRRVQRIA